MFDNYYEKSYTASVSSNLKEDTMKYFLFIIFLAASGCVQNTAVQPGKGLFYQKTTPEQYGIVKQEKFYSAALKSDWDYSVYYPAGYESSGKKYPVLYILHGLTDDYMSWVTYSSAQLMLDKAIAAKIIPPMVVIFPDGWNAWYSDIPGTNMRSAFINDLFPYAETNFRLINKKSARAIAGQSMGGHGTLIFSMLKPGYFAAAAALSPAITKSGKPPVPILIDFIKAAKLTHVYGEPFSQEKWDEYSYNPIYSNYIKQPEKVNFFVANGGADVITPIGDSQALIEDFKKDGVSYEYLEEPFAIHSWTFWTLVWEPLLIFMGKNISDKE